MRVRFTLDAETDLTGIGDWIARDNPDTALRFIRQLREKATAIGDIPFAFPALDDQGQSELRKRTHRNYAIIYRVTNEVEIVRVIDARRDYLPLIQDL